MPHEIGLTFSNTLWKIINNEFTNDAQWALEFINAPGALIANNTVRSPERDRLCRPRVGAPDAGAYEYQGG